VRSLRDLLFANPRIDADRIAIVAGQRRISFGDLKRRVAAVAGALRREGVNPGDRVAVLLENKPEFVETYFAVTGIGAVFVPLNWRLHPNEHRVLMQDSEPKVLITDPSFGSTIQVARDDVPSIRRIVVVDDACNEAVRFADWSAETSEMPDDSSLGPETGAAILYTSGTTSRPKGVFLSHGNYLADISNVTAEIKPEQGDVNLQLSPLYHAACVHSLVHLASGATTVLEQRFDPRTALELIERERVTYFFAVPTMLYQIMDHPEFGRFDLSSLKTISYGAAAITGARLREALDAFGPKLIHAYGLTESTSHCSILRAEEHALAAGSIGRGLAGVEVRVVDSESRPCPPREVGEIIARGANVMMGYWRNPELTAETIVDGWLRTGDLGTTDERGFVYVVDRKKDLVISGGVNIYPREVEEVISTHPAVAEVATFGIPDELWGEALMAAIVVRSGASVSKEEIIEMCRSRLGGYKVPKRIELVAALPRNPSGKILKTELRKRFAPTESAAH